MSMRKAGHDDHGKVNLGVFRRGRYSQRRRKLENRQTDVGSRRGDITSVKIPNKWIKSVDPVLAK